MRFSLHPAAVDGTISRSAMFSRTRGTGNSPYFRTAVCHPRERTRWLNLGVNATARIILLGLVMDAIYQGILRRQFYLPRW
jgi:hypothetical protein